MHIHAVHVYLTTLGCRRPQPTLAASYCFFALAMVQKRNLILWTVWENCPVSSIIKLDYINKVTEGLPPTPKFANLMFRGDDRGVRGRPCVFSGLCNGCRKIVTSKKNLLPFLIRTWYRTTFHPPTPSTIFDRPCISSGSFSTPKKRSYWLICKLDHVNKVIR